MNIRRTGILAALASAFFLGMAPVFGKQAILAGLHWSGVVALRTVFATLLLLLVIGLSSKRFLYIYPAGLLGCLLAGTINGIGSLLYYGALARINASLGQLLYAMYPLFVLIWLWLDHQPPGWMTLVRLLLVIPGVYLLTRAPFGDVDLVGVAMMLGSAALYALHLPINQRVLYDMPAPTVTLYTLTAMSLVVVPAHFISTLVFGAPDITPLLSDGPPVVWQAVIGLTLVTFFSRLTLFLGVKNLGGLQTALLGIGELLVTLLFSHLILGERLAVTQWVGAGLLLTSLILISVEKKTPRRYTGGWLSWLSPPDLPKDLPLP